MERDFRIAEDRYNVYQSSVGRSLHPMGHEEPLGDRHPGRNFMDKRESRSPADGERITSQSMNLNWRNG